MLIKSSGQIEPGFFLFTLGNSSHYLMNTGDGLVLFDPGLSIHIPALLRRIEGAGLNPSHLTSIFLTHGHADRMGGIAALRSLYPSVSVFGSPKLRALLDSDEFIQTLFEEDSRLSALYGLREVAQTFEEFAQGTRIDKSAADSDVFRFSDEVLIRTVGSPGHTIESNAYYVQPFNYFVCDETYGYYQGRFLASPGGDNDLAVATASIARIRELELFALCLPQAGTLTGNLIRKHLHDVVQNTEDLLRETREAYQKGIAVDEIHRSIRESFYKGSSGDPVYDAVLSRSFTAVCNQIQSISARDA